MPLRVLHIFDHSLPLQSGYAFRSHAILVGQHALGWQTLPLTTPKQGLSSGLEETVAGIGYRRTPAHAAPSLFAQMTRTRRRLRELVGEWNPHLIHAHSPVLNALPALSTWRGARRPVVYEVRASWEDAAVDHGTAVLNGLRYRASRALETFALHAADAVVTICDGLRRDIVARGVPDHRVYVVPNGVDPQTFAQRREPNGAMRAEIGLQRKKVIGFAGSFYHYEGLALLLDAMPRLLACLPDLHLVLVGGGPQDPELRHRVRASGLSRHVTFAGRVPHEQVADYYDLIDLLVYPRLPSRLTELVTPLKPLEAMAQGRLVMAADVGGHRELIAHGRTGYLFEAGSVPALVAAIARAFEERECWPSMLSRAREFVERERTWALSVARYRNVYASVLEATERPLLGDAG